jgi:hypothetical protein
VALAVAAGAGVGTLLVGPAGKVGATTGSPPAVPSSGAYLGAFVVPHVNQSAAQADVRLELADLSDFDGAVGRPLGIAHVYQSWRTPVRTSVLAALAATGATPLVDWTCTSDASIVNGSQDALITSYADALAAYGRPVFLRFFWEMNLVGLNRTKTCQAGLGAAGYVQAWQHIWTLFHQQGATNVAFVWCPSVRDPTEAAAYYPGDGYVDWIGFDGYDRTQDPVGTIATYTPFYDHWIGHGKPMMIGETGATTDQATFLADLRTALPTTYPGIKALVYYDSKSSIDWTLADTAGNPGLSTFVGIGQTSYFEFPFVGH